MTYNVSSGTLSLYTTTTSHLTRVSQTAEKYICNESTRGVEFRYMYDGMCRGIQCISVVTCKNYMKS